MAVRFVDIIKPAKPDSVEAAQRRLRVAQALQAKALQGLATVPVGGPVQPVYGVGHALTDMLGQILAARAVNRAERDLAEQEKSKRDMIAQAMTDLSRASDEPDAALRAVRAAPDNQLMQPVYSTGEALSRLGQALGPDAQTQIAAAMASRKIEEPERRAQREFLARQQKADIERRITELLVKSKDKSLDRESKERTMMQLIDARRDIAGQGFATDEYIARLRSETDLAIAALNNELKRDMAEAKKPPPTTTPEFAQEFLRMIDYNPETGVDEVSGMIKKSTGGYLQKLGADAAGVFNVTTPGREQIGKLKSRVAEVVLGLLGGRLGAGVSNPDRDFMLERAADIGNDKLPVGQRLAAWNDLVMRMRRIASGQQSQSPGWGAAEVVQ